eukprot:TRINITY_DN29204_c0_g1_i1.p1 TRINITY_DN29204_c0_g1~~TRINITY_DN29204_c0_g1_i1.p1  ORF type:complete len:535 (-),score=44.14 TRINITY_DN29204_c0_g1_i1:132-1517(-)
MNWTWDGLRAKHGKLQFYVRSVDSSIYSQFSHEDVPIPFAPENRTERVDEIVPLGKYLRRLDTKKKTGQIFAIGMPNVPESMLSQFPLPDFISTTDFFNPIVSIGSSRHAAAFHTHGDAWLATVQGTKRWFLLPPERDATYPIRRYFDSPLNWSAHVAASAQQCHGNATFDVCIMELGLPLVCDVSRGEGIYVPFAWWHATVNLGKTLAVGHQRSLSTYDEEELMAYMHKYPFSRAAMIAASGISANASKLIETFERFSSLDPKDFFLREQVLQAAANELSYLLEGAEGNRLEETQRKVRDIETQVIQLHKDRRISGAEASYVLHRLAAKVFDASALRSEALRRHGFPKIAERLYRHARTFSKNAILAQNLANLVCENEEREDECVSLLEDLLELDPSHTQARENLKRMRGPTLAELEDYANEICEDDSREQDCILVLQKLVELDPNHDQARANLHRMTAS